MIFIILGMLFFSCKNHNSAKSYPIDTTYVIKSGANYIFEKERFAPEFYAKPLKIVKCQLVPPKINFMHNGQPIQIVDKKPLNQIMTNWQKPEPYLEIMELKRVNNERILLRLLFPTTGNEYTIWFKKEKRGSNLRIDSLSHSKI